MQTHIRLHQATIAVNTTPNTWVAAALTEHLRDFSELSPSEPTLSLDYRRGPASGHVRKAYAHGREVSLRWSPKREESKPACIAVEMNLTLRSAARALRMSAEPSRWQESRRKLLLRYGFEHPITAHLQADYGFATLHAAATSGPRGGVLILGTNNSGKSTLACTLVEKYGHTFLADNFCPTDGEKLIAFPGAPRPKAGTILPLLRPTAATVPHSITIILAPSKVTRALKHSESYHYITNYVDAEREDHRDSQFYAKWHSARDARRDDLHLRVMDLLSARPVVLYNWSECGIDALRALAEDHL